MSILALVFIVQMAAVVPTEITTQTAIVSQVPENPDPNTTYLVKTADELKDTSYHVAKDILFTVEVEGSILTSSVQEDQSLMVWILDPEDMK